MIEGELRKFRNGEAPGKPIGGNISKEPFPQALYNLAVSRGYESQSSLAKVFGHKGNDGTGFWYQGKRVPTPDYFGALLMLFKPKDEELDALVEPYRRLLAEGKGSQGNVSGTRRAVETGRKCIKPSDTPLGSWIENYAQKEGISLQTLAKRLQYSSMTGRDGFGLESMSYILQKAPEALGLSKQQTKILAEAVAKTIVEKISQGYEFRNSIDVMRLKQIQQELQCTTFTGPQAARKLGTSRQNISLLRQRMDLPMLLTENDIARMAKWLEGTKKKRTKTQEYYSNKRQYPTNPQPNG